MTMLRRFSLALGACAWMAVIVGALAQTQTPASARASARLGRTRARLLSQLARAERRGSRSVESLRCNLTSVERRLGLLDEAAAHMVTEFDSADVDRSACLHEAALVLEARREFGRALLYAERALTFARPRQIAPNALLVERLVANPEVCRATEYVREGGSAERLARAMLVLAGSTRVRDACGVRPPPALDLRSCADVPTAPYDASETAEDVVAAVAHPDYRSLPFVRTATYCRWLAFPAVAGVPDGESVSLSVIPSAILIRLTASAHTNPQACEEDDPECGEESYEQVSEVLLDRSTGAVLYECEACAPGRVQLQPFALDGVPVEVVEGFLVRRAPPAPAGDK